MSLFDVPSEPTVICRSSQKNEPIEWQANFFASCLLMPRSRVHDEWKECLATQSMIYKQGRYEAGAVDDALFENVAKPIARRFGVSPQAMCLRLEKLGLLLRQAPQQASLTADP